MCEKCEQVLTDRRSYGLSSIRRVKDYYQEECFIKGKNKNGLTVDLHSLGTITRDRSILPSVAVNGSEESTCSERQNRGLLFGDVG